MKDIKKKSIKRRILKKNDEIKRENHKKSKSSTKEKKY